MSSHHEQYVVFSINQNLYGISIQQVSEIIRMRTVNWIPNSQEEFLGIIHLREQVIPIISLHRMFFESEKAMNSKTRIIVIHTCDQEIGIVVDEVEQVMFLTEQNISPSPYLSHNESIKGVYHHENVIIALLDLKLLFKSIDLKKALV